MSALSYSHEYVAMLNIVWLLIMAAVHNAYKYNFLFSLKIRCLYFYVDKCSQVTHFSCTIPHTAQVYSGKPREGQYSRHHNIKEGNEIVLNNQQRNSWPMFRSQHISHFV